MLENTKENRRLIKSLIKESLKHGDIWISFSNTELMINLITYLVNLKIFQINSNYTKVKVIENNAISFLNNGCKI